MARVARARRGLRLPSRRPAGVGATSSTGPTTPPTPSTTSPRRHGREQEIADRIATARADDRPRSIARDVAHRGCAAVVVAVVQRRRRGAAGRRPSSPWSARSARLRAGRRRCCAPRPPPWSTTCATPSQAADDELERVDGLVSTAESVDRHRRLRLPARLPRLLEPGDQGRGLRQRHGQGRRAASASGRKDAALTGRALRPRDVQAAVLVHHRRHGRVRRGDVGPPPGAAHGAAATPPSRSQADVTDGGPPVGTDLRDARRRGPDGHGRPRGRAARRAAAGPTLARARAARQPTGSPAAATSGGRRRTQRHLTVRLNAAMAPRTAAELRRAWTDFFAARQHTIVPSASLIPTTRRRRCSPTRG